MSTQERSSYFDLLTTGIGYINRIAEVAPEDGLPFLVVSIAALRGSTDRVRYTYMDCRVSGSFAQDRVRQLLPHVDEGNRVLVRFKLSDLFAEPFTFSKGARVGETGVNVKARLISIDWAKVNGKPFDLGYTRRSTLKERDVA